MTPTEAAFEAILDDAPDDWTCREIYAQMLDDIGEYVRANGQRWQARKKRRSERWISRWRWWTSVVTDSEATIGDLAYDIPAMCGMYIGYPTRRAAEVALAEALDQRRLAACEEKEAVS